MAHSRDTSHSMPELMTRVAVTLGVLAVDHLGTHLPLAGIDQKTLANLLAGIDRTAFANLGSAFAVGGVSIFALAVTPIMSAPLVVEVVRLASERFNTGPAPHQMHGAWITTSSSGRCRLRRC